MNQVRTWIAGTAMIALGALALCNSRGDAGEDKALTDGINKIAAAIKKGDKTGAKTLAEAVAKKYELDEIMHAFKPRKKGGIGVGANPGAINPDGIEQMILKLKRDVPTKGDVDKNAEAWEALAYHTAALGAITAAKAPTADKGKKTKKDWIGWSNDQVDASIALAKAVGAKGPQEIKTAADKLNTSCNSCHSTFR